MFRKKKEEVPKTFDWDQYWKDISDGITLKEQKRKSKNLEYWIPIQESSEQKPDNTE